MRLNIPVPYSSDKNDGGFTLIEVMAGMVLLSILWLGVLGILRHVEQNRQDLLLKQQVIFALDAEMKRLYYLYNRGSLWSERATHSDSSTGEGRWIYRATPAAATCPTGKPNCFLHTSIPSYAQFLQGELTLLPHAVGSSDKDYNLFWVDRGAKIVGKLFWTLVGTGLDACCRKITLTMTWPYRFQDGGESAGDMGPVQTITLEGIVGVETPTLTSCWNPSNPPPAISPVPKTGQTTSYAAGDDGELQKGVVWPSPRFTDNGNGTVTDKLTGLIWLKNANCFDIQIWTDALASAHTLANGTCGLTDNSVAGAWRLPNINEIKSLVDHGHVTPSLSPGQPFSAVQSIYWSSSTHHFDSSLAWIVYLDSGGVTFGTKAVSYYTWPVRSGLNEGFPSPLPITGQTTSFGVDDDGSSKQGIPWPSSRFIDIGNGTIADLFTGLNWMKNANCFGYMTWSSALAKISDLNNNIATCSGYSGGYNDWRMPNINEIKSLIDYGNYSPALPTNHLFSGVQTTAYWSGNTQLNDISYAWYVNLGDGDVWPSAKNGSAEIYVWPVRGGQ
ncbi:MAG: DUF1566 domain-containing protein [Magnetococcales bacterium]|nr:DUF1566 domain-containing protein [Magnetococcales bacterium]